MFLVELLKVLGFMKQNVSKAINFVAICDFDHLADSIIYSTSASISLFSEKKVHSAIRLGELVKNNYVSSIKA